mmetsp:Transcript_42805/g.87493  ORF Transcript_42805/g.87493 Transcript_42805/m.87493 type:complete len:114 (-) Transcript_42805:126-467(-)
MEDDMEEERRLGVGRDRARLLEHENQFPMKPVLLAAGLLFSGIVLLSVWGAIMTGLIDTEYWWPGQGWKQPALAFFVLGCICILPGGYTIWIAFCAWRGYRGYSFSQIPSIRS